MLGNGCSVTTEVDGGDVELRNVEQMQQEQEVKNELPSLLFIS